MVLMEVAQGQEQLRPIEARPVLAEAPGLTKAPVDPKQVLAGSWIRSNNLVILRLWEEAR